MQNTEQIFDIPDNLRTLLQNEGMLEVFELRPLNQQKGYVRWLQSAKTEKAREHHVICLIEELRAGAYMAPNRDDACEK